MHKLEPYCVLGNNPFLKAVLGNPIELLAIVLDIVLFCALNIFIAFKEARRVKELALVIVAVLNLYSLLEFRIILLFLFLKGPNCLLNCVIVVLE